jgi:nucleotide-binding universal stress UspA family protein
MVVLDGSERNEVLLTIAANLARRHDAHLVGLCALELLQPARPGIQRGSPLDAAGLEDMRTGQYTEAAEQAVQIEAVFREQLRFKRLQGDWQVASGNVGEMVIRQARRVDLVILGQTNPDQPPPPAGRHLVHDVLLTSGRPTLVIPYVGAFETVGTRVLVGWNESREAARALNDAIPMIANAESVTIVAIRAAGRSLEPSEEGTTSVADHLARHGMSAVTARATTAEASVADTLLSYAADLSADLLVVGGYGHSRLRELVLGGITRQLLLQMTLPVLMSH